MAQAQAWVYHIELLSGTSYTKFIPQVEDSNKTQKVTHRDCKG